MKLLRAPTRSWFNFAAIIVLYVVLHGLTTVIVKPIQELTMSDVAVYASLAYLPHGVRVLATVIMGWKAILPLIIGNLISALLFVPDVGLKIETLQSVVLSSASPFIALEVLKWTGQNFYAHGKNRVNWKQVMLVGALSSLINALGQSIIFRTVLSTRDDIAIQVAFAVGDMVGLFITMLALMLVFRWIRLASA